MSRFYKGLLTAALLLLPASVFAQGTITGVVKDTSGAVLPGVTVEAASPALIEKTRSVISDGTGQYRIVDLRPGQYVVTFSLTGFNTVKREGIELTGSFVATINAEMKVGSLEETITVTGETPIVDVQSTTKERVLSNEVINALPTGRLYQSLGSLVPGVSGGSANDLIGGAAGDTMTNLSVHGSSGGDMRITVNGVTIATLQAGGSMGMATPDPNAAQEVTIDTASVDASLATGGVRINFIPRDGGNTFKVTTSINGTAESLQGNNYTSRAQALGLTTPNNIKRNWDINPSFGGPLQKDRIWYWVTLRHQQADNYVGNAFLNANANLPMSDPNSWFYKATSDRAHNDSEFKDGQIRMTWQATARNKFAGTWDQQWRCQCPMFISSTRTADASNDRRSPTQRLLQGEWTAPITSRLLLEAVGLHRTERWGNMPPAIEGFLSGTPPGAISVTDQFLNNLNYRGSATYNNNWVPNFFYRAAASYITGAHSFKFGFNDAPGYLKTNNFQYQNIAYRISTDPTKLASQGGFVPNQVTEYALNPFTQNQEQNHDFGLFAQDRWTMKQLTLNYGLRYDWYKSGFPDQQIGPATLAPTRDLSCSNDTRFCAHDNLNWKDIEPRFGVVYDLFGNGRTALRATANKYLAGQGLNGLGSSPNPGNLLTTSTARTWTDKNGNFVPDCNLALSSANGECGAFVTTTFGTTTAASRFDKNLLTGWGHRSANWEFSAGVQHQIAPRVSIDVAYFRRIFENFQVTDNLRVDSSNYTPFSFVVPVDSRLPGEVSGSTITGLFDVNTSASLNCNTLAEGGAGVTLDGQPCGLTNYGKQTQHWDGMDFTVNARLASGLLLQGGYSFGRQSTDSCAVKPDSPGATIGTSIVSSTYCKNSAPMFAAAQVKFSGSYTIPKVDVRVSATYQSLPGPVITASETVTCATQTTLGRACNGGSTVSIGLLENNQYYNERLNQLDLRFGKIVKYKGTRTSFNVDLYNALNVDTVLGQVNTYAPNVFLPTSTAWQAATSILTARFVKLGMQFDF